MIDGDERGDRQLKEAIRQFSGRELEQRKHWYTPAAEAYDRARPAYPPELIAKLVAMTDLSSQSKLLEVGCGPGTATRAFAPLNLEMVCLEPNPAFVQLACHNCQPFSNVIIQHCSFEEWELQPQAFDVVLAASSFHWIPAEIAYPKAADALVENGSLILLWNKELQPSYEVFQHLSAVYADYAPSLAKYEDEATQIEVSQSLGRWVEESEHFTDVRLGYAICEYTYSADRYLMLLNSYSPYIQLDPDVREGLFVALREAIERDFGGSLQLSNICAFHVARKA
ncbi:MAG: class I SAM-dependent methyltransferase [Cyanobacteria bacterium P01_A01_bin.3]